MAHRRWIIAAGLLAVVFGVVTIAVGGRTLFGGEAARAEAGAIVPFVLWFNFLAGFAYVIAGAGLLSSRRWAAPLSAAIAAATLAVFLAFAVHILGGGAYEARTVGAITIRSLVWIAIAAAGCNACECGRRSRGRPV